MRNGVILVVVIVFVVHPALSQSLRFFSPGDVTLENGQVIHDCRIGFRTFGTLNDDSSNVIIYPTWFGGTSAMISNLIGPGKIVDDSEFFIIAIDALGNGISSSPSNSTLQPGTTFPSISIGDMVDVQYRLLKEFFGFREVHGAVGGSLGGMQVFEWLTRYPGYIRRAVPYVSTPRLSTYDLLIMNFRKNIIEVGRGYMIPDREIATLLNMNDALFGRTRDYIHERYSRDEFEAYLASLDRGPSSQFTVDDYLVQLDAIIGHDISRNFGGSMNRAAERVNSSVMIIVAETDHLIHPEPAVAFAQAINAGLTVLQNDCGHLAVGCELEKTGRLIQAFFAIE
jgi:homoserine O-acetyltransferase/O-succinyltransferase